MALVSGVGDLRPGDIGFGPIGGVAGAIVALGQMMLGDEARFRHVFVVTEPLTLNGWTDTKGPMAVEAMPSGARCIDISDRWDDRYVYIRVTDDPHVAQRIADGARELTGTKYSIMCYLALALREWGIDHPLLRRYISSSKRMICSQLADEALRRAGITVFTDDRLPQDVIPGALFYQLMRIGARAYWPARPVPR